MQLVTVEEVHAAADEVDCAGGKVGPRPVHALLGRGSFSTISRHLEPWVPAAPVAVDKPCPSPGEQCANLSGQLSAMREMFTVRRKPGPKPKSRVPADGQVSATEPPAPASEFSGTR